MSKKSDGDDDNDYQTFMNLRNQRMLQRASQGQLSKALNTGLQTLSFLTSSTNKVDFTIGVAGLAILMALSPVGDVFYRNPAIAAFRVGAASAAQRFTGGSTGGVSSSFINPYPIGTIQDVAALENLRTIRSAAGSTLQDNTLQPPPASSSLSPVMNFLWDTIGTFKKDFISGADTISYAIYGQASGLGAAFGEVGITMSSIREHALDARDILVHIDT